MIKVALINPKSKGTRVNGIIKKLVTFYRVTFPVLAAYTPDTVSLDIYEENVERINFDKNYDLVGITVLTSAFERAKEITEEYQRRGTKVVWGGIHPTIMPEESKQYADSIVKKQGELAWRQLLEDFENNNLKTEYESNGLKGRKLPDRSILNGKSFYNFETVETSRGCPNICNYCSIPIINNSKFQQFSIDSVIEDILTTNGKYIFFVDDNLIGNPKYARKLFESMKELNKKWLSQVPVYIGEDEELLELAADSGCIGLYLGLESISQKSLLESNKKKNKVERYSDIIKKIHDYGIGVEAGFIFGFDNDDINIFEKTLEFVDRIQIDSPNFHILTPYPKTPLFQRLDSENRLLHKNWEKYNTGNVVFKPKQMSPEELQEGYNWICNQTYSWERIIKRTLGSNHPLYTFVINTVVKENLS